MIVSIYLDEHQYLIDKPQTINLGGEYLYTFKKYGRLLEVQRKRNDKYIRGFFNITESKCSIQLLSAVVGQNGVGKSSILDIVRSIFVKNIQSMPHSLSTVLVEVNGVTKVLYTNSNTVFLKNESDERITLESVAVDKYQSIYYSPHLDLKYNNDFDNVDDYDISQDQFIKSDLVSTYKKGSNENGWKFPLHEELLLKNSMRQIEFLNSNIYKDNLAFRDIFDLPKYESGILIFRDVDIDDFHNVPNDLRSIIQDILKKLEKEHSEWFIFRDTHLSLKNDLRQALVNKYLLERFVIKAFLSVIIQQMEKSNTWLGEGLIDDPYNTDRFSNLSAAEVFSYFIKESYIQDGKFNRKIFNHEEILAFFEKLNYLFSKETNPQNIKKQSIRLNLNELKEIFELHKSIIINLLHYYPKSEGLIEKSNYTDGILHFRPTDRNMSSGENALLNFYSKLYNFIESNLIKESKSLKDKENYIILLDEADLGFHPIWKKRFINAILKSLSYFFESLDLVPKLQIIISTHDPLTLSDIPINNVVFLYKNKNYCSVMEENDKNKIQKTFGANITDLLANSFFIQDGLIGDFAKSKIKEVIKWIEKNKNITVDKKLTSKFREEFEYNKRIVSLIDEKIIKIKLAEMINDLVPDQSFYNQVIDKEIEFLRSKKK